LAPAELDRAQEAGLSDGELSKARNLINAAFGVRRPRRGAMQIVATVSGAAVAALLAFITGSQLASAIDSPLVAATLTGVAVVTLAPMAAR
jgi:hypothetical protein